MDGLKLLPDERAAEQFIRHLSYRIISIQEKPHLGSEDIGFGAGTLDFSRGLFLKWDSVSVGVYFGVARMFWTG